ncbi:nucleoside hydrolase [Mariniflexile maritimum]|uniref:hypothetical protein n=1 Tax=Mariniflexile maritimum TaxID=2682493 RepID=UPI0018DBA134|nr:hypothetical protein [Mariniflexile maritimum]
MNNDICLKKVLVKMKEKIQICFIFIILISSISYGQSVKKKPLIVITDLYHPYQDPGDNLDLINAFALPDVDLKAVILDITDSFRKEIADHPTLWKDPRGPREAGIIPVEQLNYIFNRQVKFGIGPIKGMKNEQDKMLDTPGFFQGVELFLNVLKNEPEPIEVLSFGSARIIAVAYNRNPELVKEKVKKIHLSGGTASQNYELGLDKGANMIPGGEWNVALDVFAFTRVLRSDLPIALYPCAGKDGGFVKSTNNTYWKLKDMSFVKDIAPQLQCYLDYSFGKKKQYDFLRAMDLGKPFSDSVQVQFEEFHVWESLIWIEATDRCLVKGAENNYKLIKKSELSKSDIILKSGLRNCKILEIRNDGRFVYDYTDEPSNFQIYYREDCQENEIALNQVIPELFKTYLPNDN